MKQLLTLLFAVITINVFGQDTKTIFATTPSPIANRYAWTTNGLWVDSTVKFTKYRMISDSVLLGVDAEGKLYKISKNYVSGDLTPIYDSLAVHRAVLALNTSNISKNIYAIESNAGNISALNNRVVRDSAALIDTAAALRAYYSWLRYGGTNGTIAIGGNNTYVSANTYNTITGEHSGDSITNGSAYANTLYGWNAGNGIKTGYRNTFIGLSAGEKNKSGYANTVMGNEAAKADTGSILLTISGNEALANHKSKDQSAITTYGSYSANRDTSGTAFTIIGGYNHGTFVQDYDRGARLVKYVTSIGNRILNVFKGSSVKNILIGYNLQSIDTTKLINTIAIGNNITNLKDSITVIGNIGTKSTGIGTTSPNATLHIKSNALKDTILLVEQSDGTKALGILNNGSAFLHGDSTSITRFAIQSDSGIASLRLQSGSGDAVYEGAALYQNTFGNLVLQNAKPNGYLDFTLTNSDSSTYSAIKITTDSLLKKSNVTINGSVFLNNASNATGDFITRNSSTGLLSARTASQVLSDIGAQTILNGTGIVKSTGSTISYLTDNSTQWNNSFQYVSSGVNGYAAIGSSTDDMNDKLSGYGYSLGAANQPTSGPYMSIGNANYRYQLHGRNGSLRVRFAEGGVFSSWNRLWHDGDFTSTNISNWNTAYTNRIIPISATISGNGTTTVTYTLPTGATWVMAQPRNAAAGTAGVSYVEVSGTTMTIHTNSATASGTNNLTYFISYK